MKFLKVVAVTAVVSFAASAFANETASANPADQAHKKQEQQNPAEEKNKENSSSAHKH